jgi:L-fucose isomerase-like protein
LLKKAKTKSSSSTFLFAIGFPIACEGDIDGALGGLIGKLLGCGPVYLSDWLEHDSNTVTLWHGGMAPVQVYVRRKSQTDFKNNSAARGSGLNHRQKVQNLEKALITFWSCLDGRMTNVTVALCLRAEGKLSSLNTTIL